MMNNKEKIARRKFKKMTEQDFTKLKNLLNYGLTITQITEITKRGAGTISVVKVSTDFADYQKRITAQVLKYAKKPGTVNEVTVTPDVEQEKAPQAAAQTTVPAVFQEELLAELKAVNQNLIRLAEAWEAKPASGGIFNFGRAKKVEEKQTNGVAKF